MISAPRFPRGHQSRLRNCQRSIVIELNDLVDLATSAGWSRCEVIVALADLLEAEATDANGLLRVMAGYLAQPALSAA